MLTEDDLVVFADDDVPSQAPAKAWKVAVIDDDPAVLDSVVLLLRSHGITAQPFDSARHFLQTYQPGQIACLVLDLRMPGMGGLELQHELAAADFDIPIIFLTGFAEVAIAVEAMKHGAFDFIEKPFSSPRLVDVVLRALERRSLLTENRALRAQLGTMREMPLIGSTPLRLMPYR